MKELNVSKYFVCSRFIKGVFWALYNLSYSHIVSISFYKSHTSFKLV